MDHLIRTALAGGRVAASAALALITLVLVAGGAGAQTSSAVPAPDNGTTFSKEYEKCLADAKNKNGPINDPVDNFVRDHGGAVGRGVNEAQQKAQCFTNSGDKDPGGVVSTAVGAAASKFWGDPIGKFTKALLEGNTQQLGILMTLWVKAKPFSTDSMGASIAGVMNLTYQAQFILLAVSLMVSGTRIAVARNRGLGDGLDETGSVIFRFILAAVALPTVIIALYMATDAISTQWITSALGTDPDKQITGIAKLDEKTGMGPAAMLFFVLFAMLGNIIQFIALVIRDGLLVVVVGLLPLAAAASALGTGKRAFQAMIGYVVSALLFKPVASLIYAAAFWLSSGKDSPSMLDAVASLILLGAAGLCMPTLMKVVAPEVSSAVGGGSAGALAGMAAGATGAVAGAAGAAAGVAGSAAGAVGAAAGGGSAGYGGQFQAANGAVGGGGGGGGGGGASSGGGAASALSGAGSGSGGGGGGAGPAGAVGGGGGAGASSGAGGGRGAGPSGAGGGAQGSGMGALNRISAAATTGVGAAAGGAGAIAGAVQKGASALGTGANYAARATQSTEQMIAGALSDANRR